MAKPKTYPITYGVLGLLAFTGPMSGYDLKQIFDCTLAPMWNATHSQIYKELQRMDELGWVEMERQRQEVRPDKKVYNITETGEEALRVWQMSQPVRGLQMRDEVLLRFTFGSYAEPRALAVTLREAIVDHEQRLALYRENQQRLPSSPEQKDVGQPDECSADYRPDPFFAEMTQFAFMFEETYLQWLRQALVFVEERISDK